MWYDRKNDTLTFHIRSRTSHPSAHDLPPSMRKVMRQWLSNEQGKSDKYVKGKLHKYGWSIRRNLRSSDERCGWQGQ